MFKLILNLSDATTLYKGRIYPIKAKYYSHTHRYLSKITKLMNLNFRSVISFVLFMCKKNKFWKNFGFVILTFKIRFYQVLQYFALNRWTDYIEILALSLILDPRRSLRNMSEKFCRVRDCDSFNTFWLSFTVVSAKSQNKSHLNYCTYFVHSSLNESNTISVGIIC